MSVLSDIANFINVGSSQAAAWYNGLQGPSVVIPGSPAQMQQQQAAAAIQAQTALTQANPTLAGILANPLAVVLILAAIVLVVVLLIFAFK